VTTASLAQPGSLVRRTAHAIACLPFRIRLHHWVSKFLSKSTWDAFDEELFENRCARCGRTRPA